MALAGLCWVASMACAGAQTRYVPGQSYYGRSNYVQYIAGDLPLIVSAPHGGDLTPGEIPDRVRADEDGDFATVSDANTAELALTLQTVFRQHYGHTPHVVICHLKRTKVDCNREKAEGTGGNVHGEQAWGEFQDYLAAASQAVMASKGRGFYIDLHGQSNPIKRLELGYLLSATQLTNSDAVLNAPKYAAQSSLWALAGRVQIPFSQLLRGSNSLGGLVAARGYPAVPSPFMPSPGNGSQPIVYPGDKNPYYHGGYNLRLHTARSPDSSGIAGLQLEANLAGVRDTAANRSRFALALMQALDVFFKDHYGIDLGAKAGPSIGPNHGASASAVPDSRGDSLQR
jgi:hypothetical protein